MNRQDIEKLLGGYATGTLTPEEERALFAAALEDQHLFDALGREQPLRDLLRDPAARAALLASLDETPVPWYRRFVIPLAVAAAVLLIAAPLSIWQAHRHPAPPLLVAQKAEPVPAQPAITLDTAPPPPPAARQKPARPVKKQSAPQPAAQPIPEPQPVTVNAPVDAVQAVVTPAPKASPPPQGELKAGTVAETVEVTGSPSKVFPAAPAAPAAPQFSASNGFLPARDATRKKAAIVGALAALEGSRLKYTVLSRQPNGEFTVANPADLHAGDTVELRLETQDTGYAYVAEGQALLASSPIEAGKPFDAVIEPRGAGQRQIECWFSPRQIVWPAAAAGIGGGGGGAQPPVATPHPPSIHITLNYK